MKLRFLMSHHKKDSVRDKAIGKKVGLFRKKHTSQSMDHLRRRKWYENMVWSVLMGWIISSANEWEDYSTYLGEWAEISRNWATSPFLVFTVGLETIMTPVGVSFSFLVHYSEHILRLRVSWTAY